MCSWYRACEGCSLQVPSCHSLADTSEPVLCQILTPILFLLVCFCPPHPIACAIFPSTSLLYNHCPLFCWKLQAYLKESASRAGSLKGTSVFNSCGLFDSLMCRRSHAQAASRLAVVFHSCMRSSTTDTTISQRTITPYWQNWGRFSEHISYHMLH